MYGESVYVSKQLGVTPIFEREKKAEVLVSGNIGCDSNLIERKNRLQVLVIGNIGYKWDFLKI